MATDRIRALDSIEKGAHPWRFGHNRIFKNYIQITDEVFNKGGTQVDLDYYIPRGMSGTESFEKYVADILCGSRKDISSEVQIIKGNVGIGKTTFINYLRKKEIPNSYDDVCSLYFDLTTFHDDTLSELRKLLIKNLEAFITDKVFENNTYEMKREFIKNIKKYPVDDPVKIAEIYNYEMREYDDLLQILDRAHLTNKQFNVIKLIFIFDNIDENSRKSIRIITEFVAELHKSCLKLKTISGTLVLCLREYNHKYASTIVVDPIIMRAVDCQATMKKKLEELNDKIRESTKEFSDYIFERELVTKLITVTPENVTQFLDQLIDYIFRPENIGLVETFQKLSSNNLKYLSAHLFNFLQSKRLPLSFMFKFIYEKDTRLLSYDLMTRETLIECLMAIHYHCFDIKTSLILNIFNLNDSYSKSDYQNTLIMPRILLLVYNDKMMTMHEVMIELSPFGYDNSEVILAFQKLFEKGIFESDFGIILSQIDKENDKLRLSLTGKFYIEYLMTSLTYLQYVSEDTPLDPKYIIPIAKKYPHDDKYGNFYEQNQSVKL